MPVIAAFGPIYLVGRFFGTERQHSKDSTSAGASATGTIDDDWPINDNESNGIEERQIMHEMVFGDDGTDDDDDSGF
jgi:hypothetical protein